jgi:Ethanolamine utilization protein EutJ (predicted chaperonin)
VANIRASGEESEQMRRQASILGIQELWKKLHDIRFKAMEVVRSFVQDQPLDAGVVLTGRAHFFDRADSSSKCNIVDFN